MNSEKVIVALDLPTAEDAVRMAQKIAPVFPFFKIGIRLFTQAGPDFVKRILQSGKVFLDLKFYDIPSVVAEAALQAAQMGVSLLTLHASGGSEMMRMASQKISGHPVQLLGVTVLTSFNTVEETGISRSIAEQVRLLADLAYASGIHGIVCSPMELPDLRMHFSRTFLMVTPGIRGAGDQKGDQKRTASPADALQAGADYLVIGRPIVEAPDPVSAAEAIARSID